MTRSIGISRTRTWMTSAPTAVSASAGRMAAGLAAWPCASPALKWAAGFVRGHTDDGSPAGLPPAREGACVMTPDQQGMWHRLQRVTMPVASYDKRFRRNIGPDTELTERQAAYLLKLDH